MVKSRCVVCKKSIPKGKEINQKEEVEKVKYGDTIIRRGGTFCKR